MSEFCTSCTKLQAEVKRLVKASKHILEHIKPLKESRDELLSALEVAAQENEGYMFNDTIQRAKALKEKASK